MDNVKEHSSYITVPLPETFRSYIYIYIYIFISTLIRIIEVPLSLSQALLLTICHRVPCTLIGRTSWRSLGTSHQNYTLFSLDTNLILLLGASFWALPYIIAISPCFPAHRPHDEPIFRPRIPISVYK
jgi:hypothetical protein